MQKDFEEQIIDQINAQVTYIRANGVDWLDKSEREKGVEWALQKLSEQKSYFEEKWKIKKSQKNCS